MKTFLFVDMEFSGLDPRKHRPLEIAITATDSAFKALGKRHAVFFWDAIEFNAWSEAQHGRSGLLDEIQEGQDSEEVDAELCHFVRDLQGDLVLAGQSVHIDRDWIRRYLPRFFSKLNHRVLDLTSIDMILEDIGCAIKPRPDSHRAEDDVRAAVERARHYFTTLKYNSTL